jgi:CheY-like chemotaxis protein
VAVRDNGCGMDEHVKAHLFEPFFTTKGLGKGTGLGLATVYGIVHQTGGRLAVHSEPGRGSVFEVYLPRTEQHATDPEQHRDKPVGSGKRETVLVAEDEDSVRAMTRLTLQHHSYTVLEARDGIEALRVSDEWSKPIHLLLTDVVMPRCGGRQLADQLVARRPALKVLFMSGYTDDVMVDHRVSASGRPFLQKPFTPFALAGKVREILDA